MAVGKVDTAGLTDQQLLDIYYKMLLARALSQRMRVLQRMGKGTFAVSAEGHEGAQVGTAYVLRPGQDWTVPYYRSVGVAVTVGMTARDVLMAFFARRDDISSGGRNMPNHFSHRELRIVSGSAPVATQVPHAVGIALASKLRGLDEVTFVYFGDGATSKGDTHEAMNFAGVHRLPVVFVCENNSYAISVHVSKQMAVEKVSVRAQGYGFPGVTVDGNDVLAVYRAALEAHQRARNGEGPTFIEGKVYRLAPHSSDDDDRRYRSREEVETWSQREPIVRFRALLQELGLLDQDKEEALNRRVAREVDEATDYAERAPPPDPATVFRHLYAE
ncbi:MAG: thiamine pyrophosphate-dependent dehydrogenase E1 component subunit alpha [Chloroflexota bacterium]|nr:thiamine pyrophosphate-dependent dehydrogenase E1 component subunit alpha [Chloroflexota bacterium]